MSRQYIYQVEDLTKKHGQKTVLDDIWLAFYPGAKIGVLGPNGAGKSTLLRIMEGWVPRKVIRETECRDLEDHIRG